MRTRVKICGVRRLEDARLASELGADAIGFVFWPASPRFIDPERARAIVAQAAAVRLRDRRVRRSEAAAAATQLKNDFGPASITATTVSGRFR